MLNQPVFIAARPTADFAIQRSFNHGYEAGLALQPACY